MIKINKLKTLSVIFYVFSGIFIAYGFIVMMYYPHYDPDSLFNPGNSFNHFVGGDAYNLIIMAGRSIGFIITGGIFAIIATMFFLNDLNFQNLVNNNSSQQSNNNLESNIEN